jgi:hypothetical protein
MVASDVAAHTSWELDWRFDGVQTRRVVTTLANGSDSVLIEGTLDGTNWFTIGSAHTGATTPFVDTLTGPYRRLRATKTGTNGAATVIGII